MDAKSAATILPDYWQGVRRNHVSVQQGFSLCGFDCETFFGRVFHIGFAFPDGRVEDSYGLGKDHLGFLFAALNRVGGKGKRTVVCGAHNLVYDLGVLFWDVINPMGSTRDKAPRRARFSYLLPAYVATKNRGLRSQRGLLNPEVDIFFGRPCFAQIRINRRTIYLIDTWSYFQMSLKKALIMIGSKVKKLDSPWDAPELIGKQLIKRAKSLPYLTNDCLGVIELLKEIERLHQKYESRLCVSLPQLSSRIFRHFYVKKDFPIPSKPLLRGALLSYHGGKNNFIGRPGWTSDCWDLDINSAYPEAMQQLPDFEKGRWVLGSGLSFLKNHPHGIYKLWAKLKPCKYGVIFSHDFKKISGEVDGVWTTGYEIAEAIRSGHIIALRAVTGYGFQEKSKKACSCPPSGCAHRSAFYNFVQEFYRLKSEAKTKSEAYFYKLILNALYGKFIQRTPDEEGLKVAGSMFDPAIASLITGFVRAKIHRLEHRYQAIHTATDGFITRKKPRASDLGGKIGQLKAETFGPVLILRNKLYLHFDKTTGELKKSGLHGFEGKGDPLEKAALLEKVAKSASRIYHIKRLVPWAQAWHLGLPPGTEQVVKKHLGVARLK